MLKNRSTSSKITLKISTIRINQWISHSTAIYLIESLTNVDIPRMSRQECKSEFCRKEVNNRTELNLENFDYWFVPVVNPDGYDYTHTHDRLWRKTLSCNSGVCFTLPGYGSCDGVDPNRNYPFHWMESGASSYSCSQTYAGPKPLSEPETAALAKVLNENKGRIIMYVSFHSFSQLILAPYGHRRVYPDNYAELKIVANKWIESVAKLRSTDYEFGTSAIKLYPASGGSDDYAHGALGIKLAFTIELPDKGRSNFLLPPSEIIPVGQEAVIGLRAMSDAALRLKSAG